MSIDNLVYELIVLLQKWQLWQSVSVCYNGQEYANYRKDNSTYGFRDLADVWSAPFHYDGVDICVNYYQWHPKTKPVILVFCEGAPLSDIMGNTRHTMDVFKLPYHNDAVRIKEFKRHFYGLFKKYNVTCLPFGICFGWLCFEDIGLSETLLASIASYQAADIESSRLFW